MLRGYQREIVDAALDCVKRGLSPICVLPTGAGKSLCIAEIARRTPGRVLVTAHRNILNRQLSATSAMMGVEHEFVGNAGVRKSAALNNMERHGEFAISDAARVVIGSTFSLHERRDVGPFDLVMVDEAHHVAEGNFWAKMLERLGNPPVVGFTATPVRADGRSLSKRKGGAFDVIVRARSLGDQETRSLIDKGFLANYRAIFPSDSEGLGDLGRGFVEGHQRLQKRIALSAHPLQAYLSHCRGKSVLVCAPAIGNAEKWALIFNERGVSAACIHSKLSRTVIERRLAAFERGDVKVLIHVDMVGEGFDLPSLDAVILATPIGTFARYLQFCGRMLRPADGKTHGILVDLADNVERHGLPDNPVAWDLDDPPKGPKEIVMIRCKACREVYRAFEPKCPACGEPRDFAGSGAPRHVEYLKKKVAHFERMRAEKAELELKWEREKKALRSAPEKSLGVADSAARAAWPLIVERLEAAGGDPSLMSRLRESDFIGGGMTIADVRNATPKLIKRILKKCKKSK